MTQIKILKILLITSAICLLGFIGNINQSAQSKSPARSGHINDFAGVVEASTRGRLEKILENLQRRTGVQFDLATVQSTTGKDIFDFSRELARDWDVGARNSAKKSLLMVVSIDDKTSFTQFSKSMQPDLPEGILGDVSQRLRVMLNTGRIDEGINQSVERLLTALGRKLAFQLEDLDQEPAVASVQSSTETSHSSVAAPAVSEALKPVILKSSGETRKRVAKPTPSPTPERVAATRSAATETRLSADEEEELDEVELTLTLPLGERITKLREFLAERPKSKAAGRARELLVSAHAALGDSLLRNRDSTGGVEQLMTAIEEAPLDSSEKLFGVVVSQIPMNLYMREQRVAAFAAAQKIEEKFGGDAGRLLALTDFYLGIERGDDATRLATKAVELSPDLAEAHYSLGLALHISLRLEEAKTEYKRAIELDSNLRAARRSLADLNRASGKTDEALTFYQEQVAADPKDKVARTGLIISLLDLSRGEEAEQQLEAGLKDDPKNATLLSGAAYWFAAHKNFKRALELATQAVEIEPRYTWSQIALARALIGERKPLAAERALRFAQQYGRFPTLDYELANVLAAVGLYEEAAEVLLRSFSLRDGEVETRLAGRITKRADNFIDLLAPERQASLFQATAADTPENARILKGLLAFTLAANEPSSDEQSLIAAGRAFASGDDKMRAYRQLYVASRLLRLNKGLDAARELTDATRSAVDDALDTPAVTVAVQADELREIRSRAIASGATPDIPDAPRDVLENIIRGRVEDLTGWVLFNQDKYNEAAEHLQRAANVLPEATPAWRTAMWHLGAALEQTGSKEDALNAYIKSYLSGERDLARRALIERLYVQVNGSLDGLDMRIGPAPIAAAAPTQPAAETPTEVEKPSPEPSTADPVQPDSEGRMETPIGAETVRKLPAQDPPASSPAPGESPQPTPVEKPAATEPTPDPSPAAPDPEPTPTSEPTAPPATETPSPTPDATPATEMPAPANGENPRPSAEPTLADIPVKPPTILKLTGRVKDTAGVGISNVVVVLISPRGTVLASTTDSEGYYTFTVSPSDKPFRLVPSKDGFIFDPIDKTVLMATEDRTVNFFGKAQP